MRAREVSGSDWRPWLPLAVLFAAAGLVALGFPLRARVYPMVVAGLGFALTSIGLIRGVRRRDVGEDPSDSVEHESAPGGSRAPEGGSGGGQPQAAQRIATPLGWFLGSLVLIATAGVVFGSLIFVAAFLHRVARLGYVRSMLGGAVVGALLLVLGEVLSLRWPWALMDLAQMLSLS